jgi:hypothetical protein
MEVDACLDTRPALYTLDELWELAEQIKRGKRRKRRPWRRWLVGLVALVAAVAVVVPLLGAARSDQGQHFSGPVGVYQWPGGDIPHGITLSDLQSYLVSDTTVTTMERKIYAAKVWWHADTIRLQVQQDRAMGASGRDLNRRYWGYVRRVMRYGLRLGLRMVLNAQTELATGWDLSEPLPTAATYAFWRHVLGVRAWRDNPRVVLDLFNEPRHASWDQWRVAFQGLVDTIRASGATNSIWLEGIRWASTLAGVPMLRQPKGFPPLVYTYHHPGSPWDYQAAPTKATWDENFGLLADHHVPVLDAEFANYRGSFHWKHMGRTVRRYFAYCKAHHIGVMAWSLLPGALNATMDYRSVSRPPQGDGVLIHKLFAQMAR